MNWVVSEGIPITSFPLELSFPPCPRTLLPIQIQRTYQGKLSGQRCQSHEKHLQWEAFINHLSRYGRFSRSSPTALSYTPPDSDQRALTLNRILSDSGDEVLQHM